MMFSLDPDFVEHQRQRAITRWKWHNPYLAAIFAFIHPIGMLYTSVSAFVMYLLAWSAVFLFWRDRPFGVGIALGALFAGYAYIDTIWRNAAIEKWKYGLPGTGRQNPKNLTPIA